MKFLKNITHKFQGMSNRKKTVVSVASIIVLASAFLMCNAFFNKNSVLDEVRLKNSSDDTSMFAIMLEQSDGTYKESSDKSWPTGGTYVYDQQKSGCIDANGNTLNGILSYDAANNKAVVKTKQAAYCYLYFSFPVPDVTVADVDLTKLNSAGYQKTMDCGTTGTATYNTKYQRIEFDSITAPAKCKFNYTEDTTNYPTLKSEVESKATEVTDAAIINSDATYTNLSESEYGTPTVYRANSTTATSGTTISNAFTFSNGVWSNVTGNMTSSTSYYYHFQVDIQENAYYQLCYTMSTGSSNNRLYINSTSSYVSASTSAEKTGCSELGYLTTKDTVKILNRVYNTMATVTFYLQKSDNYELVDVGYRYTGKQPDNWVWFNNEKWRIIGSIPTTLSDGTKTNLVKIIRSESIGALAYTAGSSSTVKTWGENSLYTLLNSSYYGKQDATGTDLCVGPGSSVYSLCNYNDIGISNSSTDYYGRMLKDVYWNSGILFGRKYKIPVIYAIEQGTISTVSGKIGLISASDYGYAGEPFLSDYSDYYNNNWLIPTNVYEMTLTPADKEYMYTLGSSGLSYNTANKANSLLSVKPVVYLDSNVYVVSGDGTEGNPYTLAM